MVRNQLPARAVQNLDVFGVSKGQRKKKKLKKKQKRKKKRTTSSPLRRRTRRNSVFRCFFGARSRRRRRPPPLPPRISIVKIGIASRNVLRPPPDESLKIYPKFHVRPIFARAGRPRTGNISGVTRDASGFKTRDSRPVCSPPEGHVDYVSIVGNSPFSLLSFIFFTSSSSLSLFRGKKKRKTKRINENCLGEGASR